ncbi:MAG TPA: acyl carrier protein [Euzebyales bacterium]|nr:acyl carrier protein [Euzebyales bacterium]
MTTSDQIRRTVLDVLSAIAPEADTGAVDPDADLRDQLDLDSFDFLNVLVELSERTGVEIPEGDYDQVATLNACVAYLRARQPAGTST